MVLDREAVARMSGNTGWISLTNEGLHLVCLG